MEKPLGIIDFDNKFIEKLFTEDAVHFSFGCGSPVRGNIAALLIYIELIDARLCCIERSSYKSARRKHNTRQTDRHLVRHQIHIRLISTGSSGGPDQL